MNSVQFTELHKVERERDLHVNNQIRGKERIEGRGNGQENGKRRNKKKGNKAKKGMMDREEKENKRKKMR